MEYEADLVGNSRTPFILRIAWAAPLQDYSIGYAIKKPNGTTSSFIKYYLRDGNKFRIEYLSKEGVAHTVEILLKDKGLVWSPGRIGTEPGQI